MEILGALLFIVIFGVINYFLYIARKKSVEISQEPYYNLKVPGTIVVDEAARVLEEETVMNEPSPTIQMEDRFCSSCGREINGDDVFCGHCGYKLREA